MTELDTPKGLVLSVLERHIIEALAEGQSPTQVSLDNGIPKSAILSFQKRKGVSDYLNELINARNQQLAMHLPNFLMSILEDKVAANKEEGGRLADLTKKDVVELAREVTSVMKATTKVDKEESEDRFTKIYNQISVIQASN